MINDLGNTPEAQRDMDALAAQHDEYFEKCVESIIDKWENGDHSQIGSDEDDYPDGALAEAVRRWDEKSLKKDYWDRREEPKKE